MEQEVQIIIKWLHKATEELTTGEELAFPAETKPDQKLKKKMFLDELKILSKIDPVAASELLILPRFKDHRYWVVIKKIAFSPLIAFKKGIDGSVERMVIEDNSEKLRRLQLMKEDGYSIAEIEQMEGSLSELDLEFLKRGKI